MPLKLNSTGGGSVTLDTPSTAGTYTVTVPATNQTLGITSGTAATASGTAVDFTGIPSWVKRITVMFTGISTSTGNTSAVQIQIGAGSVLTSGYSGYAAKLGSGGGAYTAFSSGVVVTGSSPVTHSITGQIVFTLLSPNTWVAAGNTTNVNATVDTVTVVGNVALSGALDRLRVTTVNGTDTFDAGTINIMYEG